MNKNIVRIGNRNMINVSLRTLMMDDELKKNRNRKLRSCEKILYIEY